MTEETILFNENILITHFANFFENYLNESHLQNKPSLANWKNVKIFHFFWGSLFVIIILGRRKTLENNFITKNI